VRNLPPAQEVIKTYEDWSRSERASKARVYSKVLQGVNQAHFRADVVRGETPVGGAENTFFSFRYRDPTNGEYQVEWKLRGRYKDHFLKLGTAAAEVWLQPFGVAEDGKTPRLLIVAMEGMESIHALIAVPGKKEP
jgi:hypothetical protein